MGLFSQVLKTSKKGLGCAPILEKDLVEHGAPNLERIQLSKALLPLWGILGEQGAPTSKKP